MFMFFVFKIEVLKNNSGRRIFHNFKEEKMTKDGNNTS